MDSIDNIVALTSMAYLIVSLIPVSHHGTNIISTVCRQPTVFHSPTHLDPYLVPISLHELITQSLPQFLHIRVREGSTQQVLKQCHSVTSICHNLYHTEIQDNLVIHQLTHARTHAHTHARTHAHTHTRQDGELPGSLPLHQGFAALLQSSPKT